MADPPKPTLSAMSVPKKPPTETIPANPWASAEPKPKQIVENLPAHLNIWQQTLGWKPTQAQLDLFQQFYAQIVEGNQRFNLTRITTPEDFWEKHLWDSLSGLAPWLADPTEEENEAEEDDEPELASGPIRMIDIGSGGGIPGIPAAIALTPIFQTLGRSVALTLLDSTRKKVQFLQETCLHLDLKATCIAERAETIGQQPAHRGQYDLAMVRAVGPAATCAEYAMPLLKAGGQAVLYPATFRDEEIFGQDRAKSRFVAGSVCRLERFHGCAGRASIDGDLNGGGDATLVQDPGGAVMLVVVVLSGGTAL